MRKNEWKEEEMMRNEREGDRCWIMWMRIEVKQSGIDIIKYLWCAGESDGGGGGCARYRGICIGPSVCLVLMSSH
jgi:hypothetical protein